MSKLKLSVSIGNYDRTLALKDGRVGIEGCDINVVSLEPEEAFHRAFRYEEFDVTEISMSSHMMTTARGDNQYVGIPAFLSRVFRHSGIYVRAGGPIREAADLRGKKIAVAQWAQTATTYIRGWMTDTLGIPLTAVDWYRHRRARFEVVVNLISQQHRRRRVRSEPESAVSRGSAASERCARRCPSARPRRNARPPPAPAARARCSPGRGRWRRSTGCSRRAGRASAARGS